MKLTFLTILLNQLLMLVGTYTDGGSTGIYAYRFDQTTGKAIVLDSLALKNPSYLTIADNGTFVYAVTETNDAQASLNTIRLNPRTGHMQLLGTTPTEGGDPCYAATNGRLVLTANYSGGSMSVFGINHDNQIAELTTKFMGATGGPDRSRQEAPHVHCATFTPDGRYVLATDFSADRLLSYRIEGQQLMENGVASDVSADSGPRHLTYSNDGRFAYLMSELSGKVTVFSYHDGRLMPLQEIVSDSVGARGGADIHLSPDGQFLYASNRLKADGIAIFRVDAKTGLLTKVGYQLSGVHPRQFNITPNGRYLLCSCRDSNVIQVFERDAKTGLLTDTHQDIHLSKPVCVQFAGPTKAERVKAALHDSASPYVIVVSHRGDWRNYPENSIPAIESVIRMGVDVMELDLKKTKDGVLVLSHDWTLDRCTTGHGNICDYTYQELLAFDLKRGHGIAIPGLKIPTLRQALEVCKDRIVVNVDQGYDYYDEVLAITEELGMTDQVLIKSGKPQKEVDKKLAEHPQNMMYMPVISVSPSADRQLFNDYVSASKPPLAFELCFGKLDELVTTTAQQVVKAGSKVWVNTIWGSLCGNYDDDRAFDSTDADTIYGPILALGTSIIQTDRPEFLIDYLKHKGRR